MGFLLVGGCIALPPKLVLLPLNQLSKYLGDELFAVAQKTGKEFVGQVFIKVYIYVYIIFYIKFNFYII